jgi:hypothetical protein
MENQTTNKENQLTTPLTSARFVIHSPSGTSTITRRQPTKRPYPPLYRANCPPKHRHSGRRQNPGMDINEIISKPNCSKGEVNNTRNGRMAPRLIHRVKLHPIIPHSTWAHVTRSTNPRQQLVTLNAFPENSIKPQLRSRRTGKIIFFGTNPATEGVGSSLLDAPSRAST